MQVPDEARLWAWSKMWQSEQRDASSIQEAKPSGQASCNKKLTSEEQDVYVSVCILTCSEARDERMN